MYINKLVQKSRYNVDIFFSMSIALWRCSIPCTLSCFWLFASNSTTNLIKCTTYIINCTTLWVVLVLLLYWDNVEYYRVSRPLYTLKWVHTLRYRSPVNPLNKSIVWLLHFSWSFIPIGLTKCSDALDQLAILMKVQLDWTTIPINLTT